MRLIRSIVLAALLLGAAAPAYADFTFFTTVKITLSGHVGSDQTPSSRQQKGFALSSSGMVATEFEYANNGDNVEEGAPGLRTLMGNLMVQTPFAIFRFQPYATVGLGYYRERLDTQVESGLGFNSGVGFKTTIFGPLKARVDYRVLKLRGEPLYGTVHRVYSGVHLSF